jgi:hypothetical protein
MSSKQKRSGFEERCGAILEPAGFTYETDSIKYDVPHKYTPDFCIKLDDYCHIWVESKGWFRPGDRLKYKTIANAIRYRDSRHIEFCFLLQAPNKKVQKGAKLTMSGWCDKHDIRWFGTAEELVEWACDE